MPRKWLPITFCLQFTVQGLKDLVWLPIEQYRKDGRIVRGFQRGAASFGTSTAMAALELTNRMVQTIQVYHWGGGGGGGNKRTTNVVTAHRLLES